MAPALRGPVGWTRLAPVKRVPRRGADASGRRGALLPSGAREGAWGRRPRQPGEAPRLPSAAGGTGGNVPTFVRLLAAQPFGRALGPAGLGPPLRLAAGCLTALVTAFSGQGPTGLRLPVRHAVPRHRSAVQRLRADRGVGGQEPGLGSRCGGIAASVSSGSRPRLAALRCPL